MDAHALSVSEFNKEVKLILETEMSPKWVRGEVSNLKKQSSGHIYFTLKDEASQLSCVMFRGNAIRQAIELREGQQILAYGEINIYEPRGNYQLLVAIVLNDGQGQLQVAFEQLKQKLAAEGLFDAEKKREIPILPRTIGIITSPTGAVIRDFISVLRRRAWQGRLIVLPAKVQGKEAAPELIEQLHRAQRMGIFDLIVICRGGGSLEDLWPFNEELLVRAVANCNIPIISAVGHEIDYTLTDFAADLRAETPSAAAEVISSHFISVQDRLQKLAQILGKSTDIIISNYGHRLEKLDHRLRAQSPQNYIRHLSLQLDDLANKIMSSLQTKIYTRKDQLNEIKIRLLAQSPKTQINLMKERLGQLQKRLSNNSLESGLKRGFVLMQDIDGSYITRKSQLDDTKNLKVIFADGDIVISV